MPPALNVRASGKNGARPPAEPLHPVLPNATENPVHGMLYRQFVSSLTEMSIFLLLSSGSAGIKIGVWISPAGLNNLGRP